MFFYFTFFKFLTEKISSISSHKKYSFGIGFENIPLYLITRSFKCFEYFISSFSLVALKKFMKATSNCLKISRDDFEAVSAAVVKNRIIECEYSGKERKLNPYKLINNSGIWYLLADDEGKLKNFTLSKIKHIKIKGDTFSVNAEFLKRIEKNDTNWFSDDKFKVTLEIKNEAMEYFRRKEFLPNYEVAQEEEEKIIISTEVAYDDEILRVVKYWLPFIKILEPKNLRDKFEELLRDYLR